MEEEKNKIENSENSQTKNLKTLRTYQGDVEEIIGKTNGSITKIAIAEQNRKEKPLIEPEKIQSPLRNKVFITVGFLLIFTSVAFVAYSYYKKSENDPLATAQKNAILNQTQSIEINIASANRENLIQRILAEQKNFNKPLNSVLQLTLMNGDSVAKTEDVLANIAPKMPSSLSRSFSEKYMVGIYSYDTVEPFIILTTDDYGASYSGMLKWEGSMIKDLGKIFSLDTEKTYTFSDEYTKNKDLRVIKDDNNNIIFAYSFIDKDTLVITKNEKIIGAIVNKIISSKTVR